MNKPSFVKSDFDFNRLFFLFVRCTLSLIMGALAYLEIVKLFVNEAYTAELILYVIIVSAVFGVLFIIADYRIWVLAFPAAMLVGSVALNFKGFINTVGDIYKGLVYYNNIYMNKAAEAPEPVCSLWGFGALFIMICFYVVMVSYLGCAPVLGTMPFWFLIVAGCLTNQFPDVWVIILISVVTTLNIILNAHHGKGLNLSALSSGSIIALVSAILVVAVFLPPFFRHAEKYQYDLQLWQDNLSSSLKNGDINDALSSLTEDPTTVTLNNEPISHTEDVELEIVVSESAPYGTIYLKGFAGSIYRGKSWKATGNTDFEKYLNKVELSASSLLSEGYSLLEKASLDSESTISYSEFLIKHKADDTLYRYVPENSLITSDDTGYSYSDSYLLRSGAEEYEFSSYQADSLMTAGAVYNTNPLDEWVEDNYLDAGDIAENEDFKALMADGRNLSLQESINYIKDLLSENYLYSNDFDPVNESEDFVENFLFYQKLGTCQHFASSAVLMFRYLGIPARYITGYVYDIDNENNSLQIGADDTWTFSVRDYHSHAWVEVYDSSCGWITVDVTPSSYADEYFASKSDSDSDSAEAAATPTPEPEEEYEPTPEPEEEEPTPEPEDLDVDNPEDTPEEEPQPEDDNIDTPDNNDSPLPGIILRVVIVLLILAVLAAVYILIKRSRDKSRFEITDRHDINDILSENLSLVEKCYGSRLNETDRTYLTRVLSSTLSEEKLEKYITACEISAFSDSDFTEDESADITEICRECRSSGLAKLKKGERFVYLYIFMK